MLERSSCAFHASSALVAVRSLPASQLWGLKGAGRGPGYRLAVLPSSVGLLSLKYPATAAHTLHSCASSSTGQQARGPARAAKVLPRHSRGPQCLSKLPLRCSVLVPAASVLQQVGIAARDPFANLLWPLSCTRLVLLQVAHGRTCSARVRRPWPVCAPCFPALRTC